MVTLDFFLSIPASWSKVKHEMANTCAIWPTSKKDIDNLCKTVLDALNKIFYKDDSQIVKLYASKRYAENPRVEIKIQSIKI